MFQCFLSLICRILSDYGWLDSPFRSNIEATPPQTWHCSVTTRRI